MSGEHADRSGAYESGRSPSSCLPSLGDPPCGSCHRCQQADVQEKCRRCLGQHIFGTCDHLDGRALQAQRHGNARSLDLTAPARTPPASGDPTPCPHERLSGTLRCKFCGVIVTSANADEATS